MTHELLNREVTDSEYWEQDFQARKRTITHEWDLLKKQKKVKAFYEWLVAEPWETGPWRVDLEYWNGTEWVYSQSVMVDKRIVNLALALHPEELLDAMDNACIRAKACI